MLDHVDLFFPNEGEACAIGKTDTVEAALQVLGSRVKLVVAKLGAKGAVAVHEGQGISCPDSRSIPWTRPAREILSMQVFSSPT